MLKKSEPVKSPLERALSMLRALQWARQTGGCETCGYGSEHCPICYKGEVRKLPNESGHSDDCDLWNLILDLEKIMEKP